MKPIFLISIGLFGLAGAMPAMASPPGHLAMKVENARGRVPLQVKDDRVAQVQQKLNDQGFDAGQVDGLWGPNTSAALRRYQAKNNLQQSGKLDPSTLAALGIATSAAASTVAQAVPTPVPASATPIPAPVAPTPGIPLAPALGTNPGVAPATGVVDRNTGAAAAAGNGNQAVATTAANAPQPAKGANSFSRGQAQRHIEHEGYTQVADLKKDADGIWRGHGMKNGAGVGVWLDYKGNVGQQ